jgi:hypothetical protein
MLDTCIKVPRVREQLRSGPAGPYIDGFAEHLYELGYRWSAEKFLCVAAHLTRWAPKEALCAIGMCERPFDVSSRPLASTRALVKLGHSYIRFVTPSRFALWNNAPTVGGRFSPPDNLIALLKAR